MYSERVTMQNRTAYKLLAIFVAPTVVTFLFSLRVGISLLLALRKTDFINAQVHRIDSLGGVYSAHQEFETKDGKEAKMDFLRKFKGIGDEYARNIGMDIFHPDFRGTIALDTRIKGISDELDVEFDSYEKHEQFYVSVAGQLDITAWELDRILYRYTDEIN